MKAIESYENVVAMDLVEKVKNDLQKLRRQQEEQQKKKNLLNARDQLMIYLLALIKVL